MSEQVIKDYAHADPELTVIIFRYFNVYGGDPQGLLGEYPPPSVRQHARIANACMDAALKLRASLTISGARPLAPLLSSCPDDLGLHKLPTDGGRHAGTKHPTRDGTCIRDYIHVVDLVDAHVLGMQHLTNPPSLYNIATGKGVSVREFVDACRKVTGQDIVVVEQEEARPGDYAEVRLCTCASQIWAVNCYLR
jgi:UDP-arabinose 4-epimerase